MEPVDINSKELQELKSEFNDLKETLNKQRIVNKELLAQVQKQKASFIGKDLAKRMSMDIMSRYWVADVVCRRRVDLGID